MQYSKAVSNLYSSGLVYISDDHDMQTVSSGTGTGPGGRQDHKFKGKFKEKKCVQTISKRSEPLMVTVDDGSVETLVIHAHRGVRLL